MYMILQSLEEYEITSGEKQPMMAESGQTSLKKNPTNRYHTKTTSLQRLPRRKTPIVL